VDEVAARSNYHRETVRLTFLGKRKKSLSIVLEKAAEVIKERQTLERNRMDNVRRILSQ
jgi:hypothetical protein